MLVIQSLSQWTEMLLQRLDDAEELRSQIRDVRAQRDALKCRLDELARGHRALQSRYDDVAALKDKFCRRVEELLLEVEDFRGIRSVGPANWEKAKTPHFENDN